MTERTYQPGCTDTDCHLDREEKMVVLSDKVHCDPCIAPLVAALNAYGIETVASCCGHGWRPGNIALADGRELVIARDWHEGRAMDRICPRDINGGPYLGAPSDDLLARLKIKGPLDGERINHTLRRMRVERIEAATEIERLQAALAARQANEEGQSSAPNAPREVSEEEAKQRLLAGDRIVFSMDGDEAWFTDGDRAWCSDVVIRLRQQGLLKRRVDEEDARGFCWDEASDKLRALQAQSED